jgi:hypothetical protein
MASITNSIPTRTVSTNLTRCIAVSSLLRLVRFRVEWSSVATGFQSFPDPWLVYTGGLASNAAIDHEFVRFIRSGIPLFVNVTNKLVQCQMAMLLQLLMNADSSQPRCEGRLTHSEICV